MVAVADKVAAAAEKDLRARGPRRAIDSGVDGIYCSNHGGRQANGSVLALDCLPDVVDAAGDTPVVFDSGVPSGPDIVKAIALEARAVAIGRPYAYGLAVRGQSGVEHVLRCLLAEIDLTLGESTATHPSARSAEMPCGPYGKGATSG